MQDDTFELQRCTLLVNSNERERGTTTNFTVHLDNNHRAANVTSVHLLNAQVPNMFDNVTEGKNFFHLCVNAKKIPVINTHRGVITAWYGAVLTEESKLQMSKDELIRVTIPPGHYDSSRLAIAINDAISESLQKWITSLPYSVYWPNPNSYVSSDGTLRVYGDDPELDKKYEVEPMLNVLSTLIKTFHDTNRVTIDPITNMMKLQTIFDVVKGVTGADDYKKTKSETSLPVVSGFVQNVNSVLRIKTPTYEGWFTVPPEYRTGFPDMNGLFSGLTGLPEGVISFGVPNVLGFADLTSAINPATYDDPNVLFYPTLTEYNEITSLCPINLSGVTEVLITSSRLAGGRSIGLHTASKTTKADTNVLAVISLAETGRGFTAVLKPEDTELTRINYNSHRSLADIDIQFRDVNGNILSLPDNYNTSVLLGITYTSEF